MSDRLPPVATCIRCTVLKYACYTHARAVPIVSRPPVERTNHHHTRSNTITVTLAKSPSIDDDDEFPELGAPRR